MFEQIGGVALGAVSGWLAFGLDGRVASNRERLSAATIAGAITILGVAIVASLETAIAAGLSIVLSSLAGATARASIRRRTAGTRGLGSRS